MRYLIKLAYGEEGHRLLQTTQNQAIGAPQGSAFDRLSHEGNLMTDGGKAQNSALRRLASAAEERGGVLNRGKALALRGAAAVADVGDVLTSPFNLLNSHYHNMSTNIGNVPIPNARSQRIIQTGQENAANQLANVAERLDRPRLKGLVPFGGLRDGLNDFVTGASLTDAAIQYGREGGHVLQDTLPHGNRVQQISQGIREGSLRTGFLDRALTRVADIVPDKFPVLGRVKTTIQSGVAHRNLANRELIDSHRMIVPAEHEMVTEAAKAVRRNALDKLVAKGFTPQQAEQLLTRALEHNPTIAQEFAGKALSQGRVLARTVPGRVVTAPFRALQRLLTRR